MHYDLDTTLSTFEIGNNMKNTSLFFFFFCKFNYFYIISFRALYELVDHESCPLATSWYELNI